MYHVLVHSACPGLESIGEKQIEVCDTERILPELQIARPYVIGKK